MVSEPINFDKWAIFCLEKDIEHGTYIQDKFYSLSEKKGLNIFVNFGDIISLHNRSRIEDFKDAIDEYFRNYVEGPRKNIKDQGKGKGKGK